MIQNRLRMEVGGLVAGRFVIEALAGRGGMGSVYRARDRQTDRTVALKIVNGDGYEARFEQEARLLAELEHPAIVRYVAHGEGDAASRFLAMEWLDGEDLGHALARGPLSTDGARLVARRIAEALVAAHARGIVHRDIKPANLFLPSGDVSRLKVLDFGIARSEAARPFDATAARITRTGAIVGSVGYMAPEQARGQRAVDARADIFALGCVLFECLTGRPAFAGANAVAVLAKVLMEEAPRTRQLVPAVPPDLDELVARMLSKDPEDRPRDAAAVLRSLDVSATARPSSSSGVADREQRMVTILLARGVDAPIDDAVVLADGAQIVELRGDDPATAAASRALALRGAQPLARVAIATGRVADSGGAAYGPIIDRVASLALEQPGIAIDDVSERLLGDRFEIAGGLLLGTAKPGGRPRTLLGRQTPHVGRDKELALLDATLRECVSEPVARVVVVSGGAGAGKSRLAYELLGRLDGEATVLIARGDPVGAGGSLSVARQLVRSAVALSDVDAPPAAHDALLAHLDRFFTGDALSRIAEVLGELVGAPSPAPSPELRAVRDDLRAFGAWVARAFADWIAALADSGPILCVIEDLHWGDGGSVAYLDDALRANASRPLMVLALARPEVHDLFPGLWSRAGLQEIRLQPLTRRAAERLVTSVLPEIEQERIAEIVHRAAGNAFHLEELIRHVAERDADALPGTLLAVAETRIARLDPSARRLLRVASVFGESFSVAGVAAMLEPDTLPPDVVEQLIRREVLIAGAGRKHAGELQFRHALLREAAYAMLSPDDRTLLHRSAGDWLASSGVEQEPLVLAEHFERGGDAKRAAPHFHRAAELALESWNAALLDSLVQRAFRCEPDELLRGRLKLLEAAASVARGAHAEAVTHAKPAYDSLPVGSAQRYAAAAYVLSCGAYVGDVELAPSIIQELLTTFPEGELPGPYGEAVSVAADILDSLGQEDAAERLLSAVEARLTEADLACRAWVFYARTAMMLRHDADIGLVLERTLHGTELASKLGVSRGFDLFRFGKAVVCGTIGDTEAALRLLEDVVRAAGNAPLFAAWGAIHIGWCHFQDGDHERAALEARKAFERDPHHSYALAAIAHLELGERTEAERLIARSLDGIDNGFVTPWVVAVAHAVAAQIALSGGRLEDAARCADRASRCEHAPTSLRSFIDRRVLDVKRARGEDARALLTRMVARIERHAASLEPAQRASFRALDDHRHVLELAQP